MDRTVASRFAINGKWTNHAWRLFSGCMHVSSHILRFPRNHASSVIISRNPQSPWCFSGEVSASRALALIACLRAFTYFENKAEHVNTVIAFYARALSHTIGRGYVPPSLSSLARWWFDVSSELRVATRILFDAGVAGLTDNETTSLFCCVR
ncbi:hypothetical protein F5148DRAFT_30543 [Russula earlei]|uniref:Uncharacterized protein n=1 Tax=Russula earlei TaxID=71964 RepID=A0ACC0TS86_9AGAM|nr:hypothetical protein F5148DRAFT_30543 [Russula earlei]